MREVPVYMEHSRVMPKRAYSDQAVHAGTHGDRDAPGVAVKTDRVVENASRQRALEHRNIRERRCGDMKCRVVIDSLKDLLHDREARDDLVAGNGLCVAVHGTASKHLDPGARVNENHRPLLPTAACSRSDTHSGTIVSSCAVDFNES